MCVFVFADLIYNYSAEYKSVTNVFLNFSLLCFRELKEELRENTFSREDVGATSLRKWDILSLGPRTLRGTELNGL